MSSILWRPVMCRDGWTDCRRSLRVNMLAQKALARDRYEAVAVRIVHGSRSADVLMPTSEALKSILHRAVDDTTLQIRACDHDMFLPQYLGERAIGPHDQIGISISSLICVVVRRAIAPDPRFETTARSLDEVAHPTEKIVCSVEVLKDEVF